MSDTADQRFVEAMEDILRATESYLYDHPELGDSVRDGVRRAVEAVADMTCEMLGEIGKGDITDCGLREKDHLACRAELLREVGLLPIEGGRARQKSEKGGGQ